MSPFPASHDEPDLVVLATLLELAREIHGEVVQISDDTWAIHGHIPYDGDVIVAEFHERAVADELLRLIPSEGTFGPSAQLKSQPTMVGLTNTTIDLRDAVTLAPADWDPLKGNPLPKRAPHPRSDPVEVPPAAMASELPLQIDLTESVVIDLTDWQIMRGNPLPKREHHAATTTLGPSSPI